MGFEEYGRDSSWNRSIHIVFTSGDSAYVRDQKNLLLF